MNAKLENSNEDSTLGTFIHSSVDASCGVGEIMIDVVVYLTLDKVKLCRGKLYHKQSQIDRFLGPRQISWESNV